MTNDLLWFHPGVALGTLAVCRNPSARSISRSNSQCLYAKDVFFNIGNDANWVP